MRKTEKKGNPVQGCVVELTTTTGYWCSTEPSEEIQNCLRRDEKGSQLSISFHSPLVKGGPMTPTPLLQ